MLVVFVSSESYERSTPSVAGFSLTVGHDEMIMIIITGVIIIVIINVTVIAAVAIVRHYRRRMRNQTGEI